MPFPEYIGVLVLTIVAIMTLLGNLDLVPHDRPGDHKCSRGSVTPVLSHLGYCSPCSSWATMICREHGGLDLEVN